MMKPISQEVISLKLINATLQSTEANLSPPFQCLLQYPQPKIIFQSFCSILEKTRDPAIKIRVFRLFQDFAVQKAPNLDSVPEDIILNSLLTVFTSTPPLCSQKDCEMLAKFIKEMLKLIKTMKIPTIFNNFVKSNSLFAPLAIVILTKDQPQLHQNTVKFIIAMIHNNLEILNIAACALFFSQNKFTALSEAAQNEFNSSNSKDILQQAILNSMAQKINFRIAAIELAHSLFHFYSPGESNELLKIVLPLFIQQFKESSVQLRTSVVLCLSDFPEIEDDKKFLTTILPHIASRFNECDEGDDDYTVAVFALIKHFSSSVFMKQAILNLINDRDNYFSGVVFASYLGYFSKDAAMRKQYILPTPMNVQKASAAVTAVTTMILYKLLDENSFKDSFESVLTVLTTPELLDDFFVQFRVFKAADMIATISNQYPLITSTIILKYLVNLKGDDVLSHIAPIVESILDSSEIITLNSSEFAPIFVSLMIKYIDDPSIQNILLPFLMLISPNKEKSNAKTDMILCDLFDLIVPPSYIDAIRTEAILKSQSSPRASLIAVSLPNCEPFLPTLSRVVRELYPEDTDLTFQFLQNGSKRALEAFIPHMLRFTDPVKISNTYFLQIVSFKTKKILHLNGIFKCLAFIARELSPKPALIGSLLQIAEAAFPKDDKIESISEDAKEAFIEMSKLKCEEKWPSSLMKKIFNFHQFAPCFSLLFPHCQPDIELVKVASDSYCLYISKTGENMNADFAESCIKCLTNESALGAILNAVFKYNETSKDITVMLDLCLVSAKTLRQSKDGIPSNIFECILSLARYTLSSTDKLRIMAKDILVSIYSLKLPVDTNPLLGSSGENLTPFSVIDFATQLFDLIFENFSVDDTIDLALFALNNRPFSFSNSLILDSLSKLQPQPIVVSQKKVLVLFFEVANKTKKKVRFLMKEIAYRFAKADMTVFLKTTVQLPMTSFINETISHLVEDEEFRSSFYTNFSKIALESMLPISASEQMTFMNSNFMQSIPVIIHSDTKINESIENLSTYLTIWLANIFGCNQTLKLTNNIKELASSYDELFQKISKSDPDPIEFSMNSVQALYQSFGTLVNALLLTDDKMIIAFCESLFALLNIQNQNVVFVSSLCISRLFTRLVQYNDHLLIEKLKKSISLSFTVCCDENCRFLAAVMNDIFTRPLFESFSEEEASNIINGTIRGVAYPGPNLKNESLAFLCKITIVFDKSVIRPQLERLWQIMNDQDFSPLVLTTITTLLQIENSVKYLNGKITLDRLIVASVGDQVKVNKNSRTVLETLTGGSGLIEILTKLKEMIQKVEFDEICMKIINKVNRSNLNEFILDLLIKMAPFENEDNKYKDKLVALLLSVLEDNNNPLRQAASEQLTKLYSE